MDNIVATSLPEGVGEPVDMVEGCRVNTPDEQIIENVKSSIRRQLPQFIPQRERPGEIAIVGGGWSLDDTFDELRSLCWEKGAPILAVNGAGRWLLERNLRAGAQMVLDARPQNAEFIVDIPGCKYMIASTCHPDVFEACKGKETYIFHPVSTGTDEEKAVLNGFYNGRWTHVIGGSTAGLRAITLARMTGYRFIHLFGIDSCFSPEGRNHAYEQAWNIEGSGRMYWALNKRGKDTKGREFRCSTWQASQAQNFRDFIAHNGKFFRLHIHGDGLLAYMLRTGAELQGD